jgi:hypothetical protein
MKHLHIDPDSWEVMARERPTWRASFREGSRIAGEDYNRKKTMVLSPLLFLPAPSVTVPVLPGLVSSAT